MNTRKLYSAIASALSAFRNCDANGNVQWRDNWERYIDTTVKNVFPSGSGFDNGTQFDWCRSTPDKLVFTTSFHHMDDNGFYDGWTEHTVTVRPSLVNGFTLTIGGRNKRDIKDYIAEQFDYVLNRGVPHGSAPVTFRDIHPDPAPAPTLDNGQDAERWDGLS